MSDEGKEPAEDRNEWWKQMEYRHLDGGPYQMYPRTGGAPVYEWERVGEPVALTGKGKTSARNKGGAPSLRKREPLPNQIETVIKYREHIDKGLNRKQAGQLLGKDYRTIEAWEQAWPAQIEAHKKNSQRK